MLTYDLENKGKNPLYVYLYQCIKADILQGRIAPNEQLPSKRALAEHMCVSIITIENTYAQLMVEGYIYSKPGKGYFAQELVEAEHYEQAEKQDGKKYLMQEEEPEHEYAIDFKANKCSMDHFPASVWAKLMREVLSLQDPDLFRTVPYNGLYVLRRAIAEYLYQFRGMEVNPSQIIIGAGTEYLYGRLLQLFGSDTVIAIEDPGYKKFSEISKSYGTKWEYIAIDDFGMDIEKLKESEADVIHVSPGNHFPTGIVMPVKRRQELLEWAAEDENRYIIEDDYDCELRYNGKMIPPMYTADRAEKVIYINTFSKSLVPSIRISYMVLPEVLLEKYKKTLSFYSCTVSSFEQYTLAKFIEGGYFERHINRMKNYYKSQRKAILHELNHSKLVPIMTIQEQNAGTHFLLKMKTKMSDQEIFQRADERDMHLSFLSDYCIQPMEEQRGIIVINYASIQVEEVGKAVRILEDIFRKDLPLTL